MKHKAKLARASILTVLLAAIAGAGFYWCSQNPTVPLEKITFAVAIQPISAPIFVAHEKGFFKEQGLDVNLQSYWAGKDALAAVLNGTAQFGTVAETPLMFSGMKAEKFYIVATIADSNQYQKIVARKDRGINGPEELIGKKIGVSLGTNAEYYLSAFLTYYGIPGNQIQLVPMKIEDNSDALARGDIDAAVVWPPHLAKAQKILGNNAVTIENDKIYSVYWNIVTAQEYAKAHPEKVKQVLRSLAQAERFINGNPAAAQAIVAKKVGDEFSLANYNFDLYQGQNLLLAMEDQARWAIRSKLTTAAAVPNFLPLFYLDGMKVIAPEAISLIYE